MALKVNGVEISGSSSTIIMPVPAFRATGTSTSFANFSAGTAISFNVTTSGGNNIQSNHDSLLNYDNTNYRFTAPVDGSYLITVNVAVTGPDGTATYNRIKVSTTNYNYSFGIKAKQDYDVAQGDPSYDNYGGSIVTHMDAGDTAYVLWSVSGGSDKADAFDSTFASFTLLC